MIKPIDMSTTQKFKFYLNDVEFILQRKHLQEFDYNGNKKKDPVIYGGRVAAASIIKQYAKKKYPNVVVSSYSETFSMGNAVNVYLSTPEGYSVSDDIYEDVNSFAKMFQYGSFNGMIDMYEYNKVDIKSKKGTKIDPGVKFVHVENKPMFGTVPDIVRMIRDYTTTDKYMGGMVSLEKAIENIKGYGVDDKKLNKALILMNS